MYFFPVLHKSIRSQTFYIWELFLTNIQYFVQGIITIFIGLYTNATIGTYTQSQMLQYYIFGVGFLLFFTRNQVVRTFDEQVIKGNIIVQLIRPYNIIIFTLIQNFSSLIFRAFISLLMYVAIITVIFSFVLTPLVLFRAILGLTLALLFIYLIIAIFCQLSLVVEKSERLFTLTTMLAFFGGGGFIPLSMLPEFIVYLPTSFLFYHPLHFIISGEMLMLPLWLVYIFLLIVINILLYRKIIRHIQVNG
ncbi:MAG: ABC-2 family transporter protein [Candidatus Woesearchaeota archaeon]